jgi:Flp pilus assembly protein TadD/TolB-like protein
MMRRVKTPPLPASEARPDIPAYLQNILDRCIAINKDLRYGSLREVIRDLDETRVRTTLSYKIRRSRIMKPVLLGLIAVLLAIAGIYLYRIVIRPVLQEGQTPSAVVSVPVLGVIPFENRTGDTGLDWYGEGIAQLIADNLARSRHIQVVSSSRIQTMRTAHRDPAALSKAMADGGIDYRITGEILPGASGMTLAARVGETKEGRNVASRRIDGLSKEALIRAADQIAFTIKKGLNIPTTENVEAFSADYASRNPAAYEAYVAGLRAFAKYGYAEAEEAFRKALEEAPDYTMARYRLARVLMVTGRQEEAMQEIRRAMAESSRLPDLEQKYIRAVEAEISRHYEDAVEAYRQIITAYPYEIEARQRLAGSLMENGRPDEALEQLKFLTEMEPEIPTNWSVLGTIYLNGRKFNEAVTAFQRFAELKPESPNAHSNLGSAYLAQGEFDLAREEYNKAIAVDPEYHFAKIDLGVLYVLSGRYGEAEKQFETVVGNPHAGPRWRIEAAYDLSYLLRAQGRFRDSVRPLEALQKEIEKESIHEALALSIRGLSLMEIGDERGAASLIKRAI